MKLGHQIFIPGKIRQNFFSGHVTCSYAITSSDSFAFRHTERIGVGIPKLDMLFPKWSSIWGCPDILKKVRSYGDSNAI